MENDKIIIYQTEDGQTQIDVRLENDTVWLTQAQMAELFEKDQSVVARHINNAIKDGELDESNMHFLHNTHYKYRPTKIYDLDVIISVGYRVHSKRGTAFRISLSIRETSDAEAVEIKEQYMRMYQFDYKIAGCSVNDFEFERLE